MSKFQSKSRRVSNVLASLVLLLGVTVTFGWLTHQTQIIQWVPDLPPMQFNTALCFILSGTATLFVRNKKYFSSFLGFIILGIASTTLVQYLLLINLNIDEIFYKAYFNVLSPHSGRMAPNTAFNFLLLGIIFMANALNKKRVIRKILQSFTLLIFTISIVSLIGYWININVSQSWNGMTKMALHTSIGFIFISVALFIKLGKWRPLFNFKLDSMVPIIILVTGFLIFSVMWQFLTAQYYQSLAEKLNKHQGYIANEIKSNIDKSMLMVIRASEKKIDNYFKDETFLVLDHQKQVDQISQYKGAVLNLSGLNPIYIKKEYDNNNELNQIAQKCLVKKANTEESLTATSQPVQKGTDSGALTTGSPSLNYMTNANLDIDIQSQWLCVKSVAADSLYILDLKSIFEKSDILITAENYGLEIEHNGQSIHVIENNNELGHISIWKTKTPIQIKQERLNVSIWPNRNELFWEQNWLINFSIACGYLITMLLAQMAQTIFKAKVLNKKLSFSIKRNQRSQKMLEKVFQSSPDALLIINKQNKIVFQNKTAYQLFAYAYQNTGKGPLSAFTQSPEPSSSLLLDNMPHREHHIELEKLFSNEEWKMLKFKIMEFRKQQLFTKNQYNVLNVFSQLNNTSKTPVELTFISVEIEGKKSILCRFLDITDRKLYEQQMENLNQDIQLIHDATTLAMEASNTQSALKICLDLICSNRNWDMGHILQVNPKDKTQLISTGLFHFRDPNKCAQFKAVTLETQFTQGIGLPGKVWENKSPLWIEELSDMKQFPRAALFKELKVTSAIGLPITVQNEVIAVLEFFSFDKKEKISTILNLFEVLAVQISRVFERRYAFDSLKTAQKHTNLILDSLNEGVFGLDTEGNFSFINPAAYKLLGYTQGELIGQPAHSILQHHLQNGDDYPKFKSPIQNTLLFGQSEFSFDEVFWRKDGTHFRVAYSCNAIMDNNTSVGAVVVFKDITFEKHSHDQLKKYAEELKRSNEELDEFAHTASVKTKEPIAFIQKKLKHLLNDVDNLDKSKTIKTLDSVLKSCDKINELIDGLLYYSKICHQLLYFEPYDLNLTMDEISHKLAQYIEQENVSIVLAKKLPVIRCDHEKIKDVITNIVINGIQYNQSKHKKIIIDYYQNKTHHIISINDNGIGISEALQEKIFKLFHRKNEIENNLGGSGIGLNLSKRIIERHHGDIWIESEMDKGSTFFISISKTL